MKPEIRHCGSATATQNASTLAAGDHFSALQGGDESGDDIVGYVFAINGKINGADVYASNALFRKMWRKLFAASVTEAISEKGAAQAAPPPVKDVEAVLAAAATAPESERRLNASVRLATRDGDSWLYAETRRADGSWGAPELSCEVMGVCQSTTLPQRRGRANAAQRMIPTHRFSEKIMLKQ